MIQALLKRFINKNIQKITHIIASAPSLSTDTNVLGMSNSETLSVSVM